MPFVNMTRVLAAARSPGGCFQSGFRPTAADLGPSERGVLRVGRVADEATMSARLPHDTARTIG